MYVLINETTAILLRIADSIAQTPVLDTAFDIFLQQRPPKNREAYQGAMFLPRAYSAPYIQKPREKERTRDRERMHVSVNTT